ncbi:MAG: phenylalanine--tRNA ligase subunit beta [Puniceicoccales bacterium]|nr:phenylalanine--tRNA ligase subunit beta [Puniceicoccales bacterium]
MENFYLGITPGDSVKISTQWLRRYLDLQISDGELGEIFTSIGLEVEGVESVGVARQATLVVGEVLEIVRHPNADKLSLCKVRTGANDIRQIVCGAKNFKVGDHVPVALPGTVLPGNFRIDKSNLRGVDSESMMCSGKELAIDDNHSGILILGKETRIGACLHDEIDIRSDTIFDLSLTANRGDCLSHIGVARDVAAKLDMPLKLPKITEAAVSEKRPEGHFLESISVETQNCECYSTICIKNIKIGESPRWLMDDLSAVGVRSINNAVDIGNWVMVETGQPVHVFDAAKISGNRLTIRQATDGETIVSLDGKLRTLDRTMMVICDGEKPLVIAGIVGSIAAEVDANTVDILIESAYFDADNVRQTAKCLNVSTESSHRFSRDIDSANVARNCRRVADLVVEICGGEIASKCWQVGSPKRQTLKIDFRPSSIEKLCGFAIHLGAAEKFLTNLGFGMENLGSDLWNVTVPAHRTDITCQADIVSECLRMHGTDKIPETRAKGAGLHRDTDSSVTFFSNATGYFSNHGFFECCNISLRSEHEAEKLFGKGSALAMRNPLSSDQNCFRNSLIPGLLDSLKLNIQSGNADGKFFETGRIALKINGRFNECLAVGMVAISRSIDRSWEITEEYDFYDAKALILPILRNFCPKIPQFCPIHESNLWQSSYSAGCGSLDREKFQAICGLLNIGFTKKFDIKQRIIAAEIVVHPSIFSAKLAKASYAAFSQFPRVSKDISLIVDCGEFAAAVESNALRAAKKNVANDVFIESINVFDIYAGDEIPAGTKNIGLTISYRSATRTLTDAEVQAAFNGAQADIEKLYKIRKQA